MNNELRDCQMVILRAIGDLKMTRNDIAQYIYLAMKSSENVDFDAIDDAILSRWPATSLDWIHDRVWSGKCWENAL